MSEQQSEKIQVHLAAPNGPQGPTQAPNALASEIEAALSFDPLAEAERITGTSYKLDETTSWLGMGLAARHGKHKDTLLMRAGDTHFSQPLAEWIAVVEDLGFRLQLTEDIPNDEGNKCRIWWHDDGLLLFSDSYWGEKSVNSANVYFNYCGPRDAMHHCSNSHAGELDGSDVWSGSRDAREGLRFAIDRMRQRGRFVRPWIKREFMWLLHYEDTKPEGYDHDAITAARLARLAPEIRAAVSA